MSDNGNVATDPNVEAMQRQLDALLAENARLQLKRYSTATLRVGEKGGICVYGLGRFPIHAYKQQWLKILDMADQIRQFIVDHDSELSQGKS